MAALASCALGAVLEALKPFITGRTINVANVAVGAGGAIAGAALDAALTTYEAFSGKTVALYTDPNVAAIVDAFAAGLVAAFFSIGRDSPVRTDWLTKKSLAVMSRRSAGMMEPAVSTTMSPGTSSLMGSSVSLPPRRAVQVV